MLEGYNYGLYFHDFAYTNLIAFSSYVFIFLVSLVIHAKGLNLKYLQYRRPRVPQFFLKNMPSVLGNFDHVFKVFQDLFFCLPLISEKMRWERGCISWDCFKGSGLNDIFHLYAHSKILVGSWFKISTDALGSLTIWNIDVLFSKSLTIDFRFSDKSLM